jgi:hypothetical protein
MKQHSFLLALFCVFFATTLFAQTPTATVHDTAYANQLLKESINLTAKSKFTEGYAKADL